MGTSSTSALMRTKALILLAIAFVVVGCNAGEAAGGARPAVEPTKGKPPGVAGGAGSNVKGAE